MKSRQKYWDAPVEFFEVPEDRGREIERLFHRGQVSLHTLQVMFNVDLKVLRYILRLDTDNAYL